MEATPRPWTLFRETYIVGGDDDCIGATDGLDKGDAEAKANAAFIVKAANAHDRLVEALEALVGEIESSDAEWGISSSLLRGAYLTRDQLAEARAALALARGEVE